MSENASNNKNVRDDEIDLLDLFRRMGKTLRRWIKASGKAFLISIVFIVRNWLSFCLSIILAIITTYILKVASPSFYTSDLILRTNSYINKVKKGPIPPNSISASDLISYTNRLKLYCKENNILAFANAIGTSPLQVKNISEIDAFYIVDKGADGIPDYVDYSNSQNVYDTVNVRMEDRFDIRVRIKEPQELTNLRDGIVRFINSDSLFQQRNRLRLKQNRELIARLDYDIIQLDSLQKVKYFEETRNMKPKDGGQIVFLQEQKTQLVYSDIYALYSRKQTLESEGNLYNGIVTILSDFSLPAKRENGMLYYGKFVIPSFLVLTVLLLIILANKKKLKEIYDNY